MLSEKDKKILQKFSKVQNACAQLKNAITVIYENALSNEELASMNSGSDTERYVASAAASMISTYLANARTSVDIIKICDYYKYENDISNKIPYFKQPIVSDSTLENLIFMDKHLTKSHGTKTNDTLKFIGETELQALISYSLSKKFPAANEETLVKLKEYLLSDRILKNWASNMTILEIVPSLAAKVKPNITNHETEDLQIDIFKAYIGALILDRGSLGLEDVYRWIERLVSVKVQLLKFSNLRGLYANDLKTQLEQFMVGNKSGQSLEFINSNEGGVHRVKVTLGQTVLGQAEALTEELANKKAASNILSNTSLLSKYSVHYESIPIHPITKEESVKKKPVDNNIKNETATKVSQKDNESQTLKNKTDTKNTQPTQVSFATEKNTLNTTNPQPILTADALSEQIMNQLTSKMASMVSQFTSQFLQNNNICLPTEQPVNNINFSDINATSEQADVNLKDQNKTTIQENDTTTENKKTQTVEKSTQYNSITTTNEKIGDTPSPKKFQITSSLNNPNPNVPKIEKTRYILTNSLEKKNIVSTTASTTETVNDNKTTKMLVKNGVAPLPKVDLSSKDLTNISPIQLDFSETENKRQISSTTDEQQQPSHNKVQQSQEAKTTISEDVESGNITTLSEESVRKIKKIKSTDPIKLPLKTSCDKGAKAKVYEIFGRFKMYPDYTTIQLGVNDFYSICSIRGEEDSFMGEGRGSSKKIAEQLAASEALENERLTKLVEARNKQVEKLLGVKIEDLEQSSSDIVDEVDTYKYFQPQEDLRELPVFDTCDKSSMSRLYAIMGQYRLFPEYESVQEASNIFHSICKVKSTAVILSEGRGTTKKISQQIAAENALEGDVLAELLSEVALKEYN